MSPELHSDTWNPGDGRPTISASWGQDPGDDDDYPTVDEAYDAAIIRLYREELDRESTLFLYDSKVIDGAQGAETAEEMKLYPARYGGKDN